MNDRHLRWVQRARVREETASPIGPVARGCMQGLRRGGPAWCQKLIDLVYDELGPDVLDHAEPSSLRRGILTFEVEDPAVAYHLRLQWEQRLLQVIAARLPQAGIHTIHFASGRPRG